MSERFPVELSRDPTANGGEEWSLRVDGERVQVGVFTEAGQRPEDMLPRVLGAILARQPRSVFPR